MNAILEKLGPVIWYAVMAIGLLAAVLLIVYVVRLVMGRRIQSTGAARGRVPRLGFVDAFDLPGSQRQLVLIRRDNVEHLVMIGGPNDVVIESTIIQAATATQELRARRSGAISDEMAAPGLAPQVVTSAQESMGQGTTTPDEVARPVEPPAAEPTQARRAPPARPAPAVADAAPLVAPPRASPPTLARTLPTAPPVPVVKPPVNPFVRSPEPTAPPLVAEPDALNAILGEPTPQQPKSRLDFSKVALRTPTPPQPVSPQPAAARQPPERQPPRVEPAPPRASVEPPMAEVKPAPEADDGLMELEAEMAKLLGRPEEPGKN